MAAPVYGVSFDVAVVVSSQESAEGGGKLRVAGIFSLGGTVAGADKEETTSRIKFVVPLRLPTDQQSFQSARELAKKRSEAFDRPLRSAGRVI
jgi:hypothetical protein